MTKRGMTIDEHLSTGAELHEAIETLRAIYLRIATCYPANNRAVVRAKRLLRDAELVRTCLDTCASRDFPTMSNEEWIAYHFYLGVDHRQPKDTLLAYILKQKDRDDEIGDLARDFARDKHPIARNDYEGLAAHLAACGACPEAKKALKEAYREYCHRQNYD